MILRAFGLDLFPVAPGTCHHDDTFLLFGNRIMPFSPLSTAEDREVNRNLWELVSNFAKHLDPTPDAKFQWDRQGRSKHLSQNGGKNYIHVQYRLDPARPKKCVIGSTLKMSDDSPEFKTRLNRWLKIWEDIPPRMHNSYTSATWRDPTLHKDKRRSPKTEL